MIARLHVGRAVRRSLMAAGALLIVAVSGLALAISALQYRPPQNGRDFMRVRSCRSPTTSAGPPSAATPAICVIRACAS